MHFKMPDGGLKGKIEKITIFKKKTMTKFSKIWYADQHTTFC